MELLLREAIPVAADGTARVATLIVDDEPLARAGMRRMLAREALRRRVRAALKRLWLDTRAALRR